MRIEEREHKTQGYVHQSGKCVAARAQKEKNMIDGEITCHSTFYHFRLFTYARIIYIPSEIEFLLTVFLLIRYILRRTSNIVFFIDEIFRYNQYLHWLDIYRLFCLSIDAHPF